MSNDVIEVGGAHTDGAKINLTIDLAPEDCYVMCEQLFDKLKDNEKMSIVEGYRMSLANPEQQ